MTSKFWPMRGHPGILHHYTETLTTFEYTTPTSTTPKPHTLLFLGGLGDGLATTSYTSSIIQHLQPTPWSLFTLNLSSSYTQWGIGHLSRDTDEVAQCIRYILSYKSANSDNNNSKIVIMGHSTGSQAVLHYLHRPNPHVSVPEFDHELQHILRPVVDGAIMQAPVSDREALQWVMKEGFLGKSSEEIQAVYRQIQAIADSEGKDKSFDTIIPLSLTAHFGYGSVPISLRRFMSLMSPGSPEEPSEDDLFSSDLTDQRLMETFGKVVERGLLRDKLVVLFSGADQSVPDWVDKEELLSRWRDAANHGGREQVWNDEYSGLIPGASHALSNDDQAGPRQEVVNRVLGYLRRIEKL
ncbi:siderophore biosynthesis lipase esterase protein [Rutstroemia sp. NJR-2017a BBW]|nr:siderophore biosynthesis lipase esterase protein [Rutstroemia sp. NJR-2017a BBW]